MKVSIDLDKKPILDLAVAKVGAMIARVREQWPGDEGGFVLQLEREGAGLLQGLLESRLGMLGSDFDSDGRPTPEGLVLMALDKKISEGVQDLLSRSRPAPCLGPDGPASALAEREPERRRQLEVAGSVKISLQPEETPVLDTALVQVGEMIGRLPGQTALDQARCVLDLGPVDAWLLHSVLVSRLEWLGWDEEGNPSQEGEIIEDMITIIGKAWADEP